MQQARRSGMLKYAPILLSGLVLLGACAHRPPAAQARAAAGVPLASGTIFVGRVEGEFAREMRAAMGTELARSPRVRIVETEAAADFVLSGGIHVNYQDPPVGWVRMHSTASGAHVWQYQYQDQRNGNELFVPSPQQQVKVVARQIVAQLLAATTTRTATTDGSFGT